MQPAIGKSVGLTLLTRTDSLVSMTYSLHIMSANLASIAVKFSIEWRSLFEEIVFAVLNSSLVGFHCRVFSDRSSNISHPSFFIFLQELPFTHDFKKSLILII